MERCDNVHHKNSLSSGVSDNTLDREDEIMDKVEDLFNRINEGTEEAAREKIDKLEVIVDCLRGRKRVNTNNLKPGDFVCALSGYKKRFLIVLENDMKRRQIIALRLVSFGEGYRIKNPVEREKAVKEALESSKYYVPSLPEGKNNNILCDRHYYTKEEFGFANGGSSYDGYIETSLENVEYIPWDYLLKVMKPSNEKKAEELYVNTKASYIAKKEAHNDNPEIIRQLNELLKRKEALTC